MAKFWNSSALEPKRQHRWLLQLGKGLESYAVKTTDKPSFTINESDDGSNAEIERWTLYNPWVKDVKFGSLDYGSDDLVEIELTLRYDFAKYQGAN